MLFQTKIKALWVCSWYPNRTTPYLGSFICSQAKATARFSDIAVLNVCGDAIEDYEVVVEQSDFLTIHVYYPNSNNIVIKTFRQMRAQLRGYKHVKLLFGKPDIVHLNVIYPSGLFCLLLYFWKKLPFVISEHSSIYRPERQLFKGFFIKTLPLLAIKWAKAMILVTSYNIQIMRHHWQFHNENYLTIPNVIDTQAFNIIKDRNEQALNTHFTFLHVSGLIDSIKNISGIIRGAALLAEKRKDFCVKIIGFAKEQAPYLALAKQLDVLDKQVFFAAEIPNETVALEMQKSDAFLMFSNVEGLPCVLLEAMSTGIPVIATETGGISDWITPETGILLNIGDEAALVEAMNFMIDNHHQYDPSVIRSKIVEKCSVEVVGKAIVSVYEEVLNINYLREK